MREVQRVEHLRGRSLEQPSTADAEKRVTTKQEIMAVERDVTERMPGNREHVKRALRRIEFDAIAIGNTMGRPFDPWIVCGINPR